MKQIPIFFLMLFSAINIFGQAPNIDSLENLVNTESLAPNELLQVYRQLCDFYERYDNEKKMYYVEKGLNLAQKEKDKLKIAEFNNSAGKYYFEIGEHETSLEHFNTALAIANEINDKDLIAQTFINLAVFYSNKGDLKTGIEYYQKYISYYESIGKEDGLATCLGNIGGMYRLLGEYDLSLRYLKRGESIGEKADDKRALIKVYASLGNLYGDLEELDKAMEYGRKALNVSLDTRSKWGEANAYQTLTLTAIEQGQYNEAEQFATECLRVAKEINNQRLILIAYNALSGAYLNLGRYKEAEDAANMAWQLDSTNLTIGASSLQIITLANIALGNKEKAKKYMKKFADILAETNNKNVRENLMEMEVKYETEKKEMRIASLEKEKQLYTWIGIGGILFALTLGIVLWQNIRNTRKEKQLIASRAVMDGEMKERTRMARDLHDRLSGNLSAVKIELNSNPEAPQDVSSKLDTCIEEVRRVAHNLMPASLQYGMKVALEDFAAQFPNVRFHFFGEEKRVGDRLEFVVYCCANELVNNSLRHSGAKTINLQLVQDDKYISLTVQDDGNGYDEKNQTKGMGLKSIYDRVTSCNGKVDTISAPGKGTETTIQLKVKKV